MNTMSGGYNLLINSRAPKYRHLVLNLKHVSDKDERYPPVEKRLQHTKQQAQLVNQVNRASLLTLIS